MCENFRVNGAPGNIPKLLPRLPELRVTGALETAGGHRGRGHRHPGAAGSCSSCPGRGRPFPARTSPRALPRAARWPCGSGAASGP